MEKKYITLTGMSHHYGIDVVKKDDIVTLKKDPDNEFDKEAIKVTLEGLGTIGYVANSPYTVVGDSMSAGRLYDKIGDTARAKVLHVLGYAALCVVEVEK